MKHFSAVEKAALLLAALFIIFGAYAAIHPTEMQVPHPGRDPYQRFGNRFPPFEHVSKEKARIYGLISAVLGIGIGGLVLYRPHK